jgi:2'-5' RNA ligase
MDSGPFDIVIFPPPEIRDQAIDLSKFASKWGTYFELSDNGPFPHISMYQAEFPLSNLNDIKSKLASFASSANRFSLSPIDGIYKQEDQTYLEVQYEASEVLVKFQTEIMELLNRFRNGLLRDSDKNRFADLSEEQKSNLKEWGYRLNGESFRPHMTISRLNSPDQVELNEFTEMNFNFTASQIGLFKLGPHGTCVEEVALFDLNLA